MKRTTCLLALLLIIHSSKGQDALFTLYNANPIGLNPAFALPSNGELFFSSNSRQQWWSLPGSTVRSPAYTINQASLMAPFVSRKKNGVGGGIQLSKSTAGGGSLALSEFTLNGASRIDQPMKLFRRRMNVHFGVGVGIGVKQYTLDWEELTFASQIDPYYGLVSMAPLINPQLAASSVAPTANVGLKFKTSYVSPNRSVKSLQFGLAGYQLNKPGLSFFDENSLLQRRVNLHGSLVVIPRHRKGVVNTISRSYYSLSHRYYLQYPTQTHETTYAVNLNSLLTVSGGFRRKHLIPNDMKWDAALVSAELATPLLILGVSYDFTVSELNTMRTAGTTEISLIIPLSSPIKLNPKKVKEPCFADNLLSNSEWKAVEKYNSKSKLWGREYAPITFQL